jgi:hypothetical protein
MEDQGFDKIFGNRLRQIPAKTAPTDDWTAINSRLDAYDRRWRVWLLPICFGLMALLALGNVFWWYQWRTASLLSKPQQIAVNSSKTDTIYHKTVVHLYDTIYQTTTIVHRKIHRNDVKSAFYSANNANNPDLVHRNAVKIKEIKKEEIKKKGDVKKEEEIILNDSSSNPLKIPINPENVLTAEDSILILISNDHTMPLKKVKTPIFYMARPRLGLALGGANPVFEDKNKANSFQIGISGDVEIAKKVRLLATVQYQQTFLKAKTFDALTSVITVVAPPSSDFRLQNWKIDRIPAITYTMQMRFQLPKMGLVIPYAGIGLSASTVFPYEIDYTFENATDFVEIPQRILTKSDTKIRGTLLNIGLSRDVNKHFAVEFGGFGILNWKKTPTYFYNQIGADLKLLYRF